MSQAQNKSNKTKTHQSSSEVIIAKLAVEFEFGHAISITCFGFYFHPECEEIKKVNESE